MSKKSAAIQIESLPPLVLIAIAVFLLIVFMPWTLLPFAAFGVKDKLNRLISEQHRARGYRSRMNVCSFGPASTIAAFMSVEQAHQLFPGTSHGPTPVLE